MSCALLLIHSNCNVFNTITYSEGIDVPDVELYSLRMTY